ncbi:hypothetical protein KALB_5782 [Kutzneria albida DSM 43870]|uniref:Bacterial EndoU nuclease domain-containing protein n=1 Tax=Kutzneria albida DSM 43870 TaxID=1449976 RepID=W5WDC1_9PSEU|nr:hypothetical protein KALB_5782 [Kutzneria albida DSM 43870]
MRRGGFSAHTPSIHDHARRTGQRAEDVSQVGRGVSGAGLSGNGLGQVGASTAGAHQQLVSRVQTSLGRSGDRLRGQSDRLNQSARTLTDADEEHANRLHGIHRRSGGPPSLRGTGGGPSRTGGSGGGRYHPYGRPGGGSGGRPGGGQGGFGGHPGGGPAQPPRQPGPGQPGWRPSNYQPTIPDEVHTHVAYGGWNGQQGRPTGGHVLQSDLTGPHPDPAGLAGGTAGHGSLPPSNGPHNPQTNGVYTNPNPHIVFDPAYGTHPKPSTNHTNFPMGIDAQGVQQISQNAWNNPYAKMWPHEDRPGGGWTGTTYIPDGYPQAGQPIKINGQYDGSGQVSTYYPAQHQPPPPPSTPPPPPPPGPWPPATRGARY